MVDLDENCYEGNCAKKQNLLNIGEIHYHQENKTNGGKQIEFSAGRNQFEEKKTEVGINEMYSNC